jgi:hypothetical protein
MRNPIAAQLRKGYYQKKVVTDKKRQASKQACRKGVYK